MSRKRYLIDSNICIMVLRNLYNAEEIFKLIKEEDCYISEITLYELWYGNEIAKQHKTGYREQKLERFRPVRLKPCAYFPWNAEVPEGGQLG